MPRLQLRLNRILQFHAVDTDLVGNPGIWVEHCGSRTGSDGNGFGFGKLIFYVLSFTFSRFACLLGVILEYIMVGLASTPCL